MRPSFMRMGIVPRSTYYDKHYRQTAALIRARQQYLVKNIFTGLALCTFIIGVCTFFHLLIHHVPLNTY